MVPASTARTNAFGLMIGRFIDNGSNVVLVMEGGICDVDVV